MKLSVRDVIVWKLKSVLPTILLKYFLITNLFRQYSVPVMNNPFEKSNFCCYWHLIWSTVRLHSFNRAFVVSMTNAELATLTTSGYLRSIELRLLKGKYFLNTLYVANYQLHYEILHLNSQFKVTQSESGN